MIVVLSPQRNAFSHIAEVTAQREQLDGRSRERRDAVTWCVAASAGKTAIPFGDISAASRVVATLRRGCTDSADAGDLQ